MSRVEDHADEGERLRRIESITDTALAHLDVPDLLDELLERVRELLSADTAAVLLLDERANELVATAASGIEEEVHQGVRIPLGEGFAGRIAADARPVILEDVDHATVRNPILRRRGIRSLLGVPLVVAGRVIGVIHVGSLVTRDFTDEDIELLRVAADRVALAVDARRSDVDRAAAAALQRSLVPGRLPAVSGLDVAARYLPGDEGGVGGDWYDLFVLPSGEVGIVIGDVVGRGLAAAVVMGRLRSALRAYALVAATPSEVIELLDRKLQHFEAGQLTTVLYAVLDPHFTTITICSAGHPLPVLVAPGRDPAWLEAVVDPPLGVRPGLERRSNVVPLEPGTLVAFFTDGLVERPGELLDAGVNRLAASLVAESAERSCTSAIAALVGSEDRRDDVALLVLRREETVAGPLRLDLPAVPSSLAHIRSSLRRWLEWAGAPLDDRDRILLAAGEASSNAVEHAYGLAGGRVSVTANVEPGGLELVIADTGHWREPRGSNRGRGLLIMEGCTDDMTVERTERGSVVRLRFLLELTCPS